MSGKTPRWRLPNLKKRLKDSSPAFRGIGHTYYGRLAHLDAFVAREFLRYLPKGSTVRFLDIGASPGFKGAVTTIQAVNRFKRAGAVVDAHAVDKEVPIELKGRKRLGVNYHELDIERNPLPEGEFDVVRAANVLQHVDDLQAAREKATRKVREGGLYLETHFAEAPGSRAEMPFSAVLYQKRGAQLMPLQFTIPEAILKRETSVKGVDISVLMRAFEDQKRLAGRKFGEIPSLRKNQKTRVEARKLFLENHPR